ncbi:YitT family protein [Neolewinella sp.]|uniref:YitT family protein n=1 Tax=Neolewinella sp. TaxID=2993543 RepID=UPI003B518A30
MPHSPPYRSYFKDFFFILTGVALAALGLKGFLLPAHFIDGGVTGICLLLAEALGWPLALLLLVVNIPFLFLARLVIGRVFALKTIGAILLLALAVWLVEFPSLTEDRVLVAIFGGFFLGTGIGLSMRGGSVLDGTEILAIFLSRKLGTKVSDWVILINLVIFGAAAMLLSLEQALYSLLTYIVASKALDFIIDGVEEYTGVTIITDHPGDVRTMLIEEMGAGVTIFKGVGGYGVDDAARERDILYTVITRLEIRKLTLAIQEIDSDAFITMTSINDVRGGMVRKRVV